MRKRTGEAASKVPKCVHDLLYPSIWAYGQVLTEIYHMERMRTRICQIRCTCPCTISHTHTHTWGWFLDVTELMR